jgi:hypothetical protein
MVDVEKIRELLKSLQDIGHVTTHDRKITIRFCNSFGDERLNDRETKLASFTVYAAEVLPEMLSEIEAGRELRRKVGEMVPESRGAITCSERTSNIIHENYLAWTSLRDALCAEYDAAANE